LVLGSVDGSRGVKGEIERLEKRPGGKNRLWREVWEREG